MARYAHSGSVPFAYHADWMSGPTSLGDPNDPFNQHAILTQNDTALMQNFFNNPDAAMLNESIFPVNWSGDNEKGMSGEFGGVVDGTENQSQTIHNPAMTLGASSSSQYHTHPPSNHHQPSDSRAEFLGNLSRQEQASDDEDVKAASGLYNMSMNSQDGSRGIMTFDGAAGGSWGTLGSNNPMLSMQGQVRSPLTSSGRQSANSHHSLPQYSARANPQQFQMGQEQLMQQYWWQQQQMAGVPRTRHASLQIDTSQQNFFPQRTQRPMPRSAHLPGQSQFTSRPAEAHFGSDLNFEDSGYRPPSGHIPLEEQKSGNLNHVPYAAQVAANGRSHVETFTPVPVPRTYPLYGIQTSTSAIHSASPNSSPNGLGGLPLHNMAIKPHRHNHPFNKVARQAPGDDDGIESEPDPDFAEAPPRKRRKSQLQREEDAEYNPDHVKASLPKRGTKAAKAHGADDISDDDYEEVTPAANRATVKRRKSSTNARPSLGSSQSGSPAAAASPVGKAATIGKKKGRGSQARQNLTEDEKRRNHIQSEKTRRDLIKLQYDALDNLVPTLKNGKSGLSRSDVLREIVAYVESVVDGNKKIEEDLEDNDDDDDDTQASAADGSNYG